MLINLALFNPGPDAGHGAQEDLLGLYFNNTAASSRPMPYAFIELCAGNLGLLILGGDSDEPSNLKVIFCLFVKSKMKYSWT